MSEVEFIYEFTNFDGNKRVLRYTINVPFRDDHKELCHRMVASEMHPIMKYLDYSDLERALKQFIDRENQLYADNADEGLLEKVRNGAIDIEGLIKGYERLYKEETRDSSDIMGPNDDEIFAQSFHTLVHSSSLPAILVKENAYAEVIADLNRRMKAEIESLNLAQQLEMDQHIEMLDQFTTMDDINILLGQHHANRDSIQSQWEMELQSKRGFQKNEYRNWINNEVMKNFLNNESTHTPMGSRSSIFSVQNSSMEESFTIHLGSQLKHMHNIRILSADVTDLCSPLHQTENLSGLNMALGLYSSSLCGVVVLTRSGSIRADPRIVHNANMSTEFHFDQIDKQINKIEEDLRKHRQGQGQAGLNAKLKEGDCFITTHSNLSSTHVIFHLISDEMDNPCEMNSRHPVILGLRNVLKVASRFDISMLTVPALLRYSMSEEMTVPWCVRRAELVFKCVKGFMIELASELKGNELSTIQFLLPETIAELFNTLSGMLPHIFRVSNSKVLELSANCK